MSTEHRPDAPGPAGGPPSWPTNATTGSGWPRGLAVVAARVHEQTTVDELVSCALDTVGSLVGPLDLSVCAVTAQGWQVLGSTDADLVALGAPPRCTSGRGVRVEPTAACCTTVHDLATLEDDPCCAGWAGGLLDRGWAAVWTTTLAPAAAARGQGALVCYLRRASFRRPPEVLDLLSQHLAVAWARIEEREQLRTAITARHHIGLAQGILMHRHRLDADQAFHVLSRYSQHNHVRVRDLATEVIATGELPEWAEPAVPGARRRTPGPR